MYRKRGNKWEVIYRNKELFQRIGYNRQAYTFTVDSEEEAIAAEAKLKRLIKAGTLPEGLRPKKMKTGTTVKALYETMQADSTHHESKSNVGYMKTILPEVGDVVISAYTLPELKQYIQSMKDKENTPGTIRKKIGALRSIFVYAMNIEALIDSNIFDKLPEDYSQYQGYKDETNTDVIRDKERDRRLKRGEEKEIRKAIEALKADPRRETIEPVLRPALSMMFDIAINSAMRLQEIFLLQWADIDFDAKMLGQKGVINVRKINTKSQYDRQVPISSKLLPILKQYKLQAQKQSPVYVLPFFEYYAFSRKKCSNNLSHVWGKVLEDFNDLSFHDFRHEAISRMVENTDLQLHILQDISGHKDARTFKRYNQMRLKDLKFGKFY